VAAADDCPVEREAVPGDGAYQRARRLIVAQEDDRQCDNRSKNAAQAQLEDSALACPSATSMQFCHGVS
jgi:hypothetical protein